MPNTRIGRSETVEISAINFARCNPGVIKLLRTMKDFDFGKHGVSTRDLCRYSFNSRNYGVKMIKRAEEYGYIRRKKEGRETMNLLTAKGRRLLDNLQIQGYFTERAEKERRKNLRLS